MTRIEDPRQFRDLRAEPHTPRHRTLNQIHPAQRRAEHQRDHATTRLAKECGHRLDKLWQPYKRHVAPRDLSRFDDAIDNLDQWDKMRYGGFPKGVDVGKGIGLVRAHVPPPLGRDVYTFGLHEIDDLFTAMIDASNVNPPSVGSGHAHTAIPEWYAMHNERPMPGLFG